MQEISVWASTVCTVAIICALFEMLVPEGNVSKMLNFVLGLFLIVSVLVPFANIIKFRVLKPNYIKIENKEMNISDEVDDLSIAYGKSVIEKLVSECLKENEMGYEKIEINMDSSTGNSIDIIRVKIYLDVSQRNELSNYQEIIREKTGITPDIVCEVK